MSLAAAFKSLRGEGGRGEEQKRTEVSDLSKRPQRRTRGCRSRSSRGRSGAQGRSCWEVEGAVWAGSLGLRGEGRGRARLPAGVEGTGISGGG